MKKTFKSEIGITLIALVITIIVLLILAGVSIAMLTGDNGILTQANKASTETVHSAVYEQIALKNSEYYLEKKTGKYNGSLINYLKDEKKVINQVEGVDGYVVDVVQLMGEKQKYGNGTDGKTDVYKLEEDKESAAKLQKVASTKELQVAKEETENKKYNVYYCASEDDKRLLGTLNEQGTSNNEESIENLDMFMIDYDSDNEEFYLDRGAFEHFASNKIIDEKLKGLTDEEIIIYDANLENSQNFETFEEVVAFGMTVGMLKGEVTSAEEFFQETNTDRQEWIGYIGEYCSDRMTILNEKGEDIYNGGDGITGKGEYIYTVKIDDIEVEQKFKITIDRYELVNYWDNGEYIGIYDFDENKFLSVESGTWKEIRENNIEKEILEENIYDQPYLGKSIRAVGNRFASGVDIELNFTSTEKIEVKGYYWDSDDEGPS